MRNPLSLEAFADWCEKQPAEQPYDYCNTGKCACAQYAHFLGFTSQAEFPEKFWKAAEHHACGPRGMDWTFGALSARLRSAIASSRKEN